MRQKTLFVCCLIAVSCSIGISQRNITNADLKVYRDTRLQADREYRENYRKWGLPSPEELDRRRDESLRDTVDLSIQLRAQRLERERIDAQVQTERERIDAMQQMVTQLTAPANPEPYPSYPYYNGSIWGGGYNNPYYYGRRRGLGRLFPYYNQPYGRFSGGQFWGGGSNAPRLQPGRRFGQGVRQPWH